MSRVPGVCGRHTSHWHYRDKPKPPPRYKSRAAFYKARDKRLADFERALTRKRRVPSRAPPSAAAARFWLWLSENGHRPVAIDSINKALGTSTEDLRRVYRYWHRLGKMDVAPVPGTNCFRFTLRGALIP